MLFLYRWFTGWPGLGLAEQARMLMHPSPLKKDEELAEYVEMWRDKIKRLEAHGEEFKLALVFKINVPRMLMTGKVKEHFDLWEADHDSTNAKKTYEELLNKAGGASWTSRPRRGCNKEETPWMLELSEDTVGRSNTSTRTASTRLGSRAKARAKEARAKENVTIAEPPGISQDHARARTVARAKAKNSKENV